MNPQTHERGVTLVEILVVFLVLVVLLGTGIGAISSTFNSSGRARAKLGPYLESIGITNYNIIGCNRDTDNNGYATCQAVDLGAEQTGTVLEYECPTSRRNNLCRTPRHTINNQGVNNTVR